MKTKILLFELICIICMFIFAGCSVNPNNQFITERRGSVVSTEEEKEIQTTDTSALNPSVQELYLVSKIDTTKEEIELIDLADGETKQYSYRLSTEFFSKFSGRIAPSSLESGLVVEIQTTEDEKVLSQVKLSDQVWINEKVTNYSIDENKGIFLLGQSKYAVDEQVYVFSMNEQIPLKGIQNKDELRVVGIGKKIIAVSVVTSQGTLKLTNTQLFEGSYICVGDKLFSLITKDMEIEVKEGDYQVTVANNGYGGSKTITIKRNEDTLLDLNSLKGEGPKIATIDFEINVEGALLWIDGEEVDYTKKVELPYGTHTLMVSAQGYDSLSKKLVVNSTEATIVLGMSEESTETEETTDSGTDSTTGSDTTGSGTTGSSTTGSSTTGSGTTGSGTTGSGTTDSSTTDYLTTLYQLLTSLNGTTTTE